MASSEVEIVSNALVLLGDKPITSLDDDTDSARTGKALYANVRDAVLASHSWDFALVQQSLAKDATAPLFGFKNRFALPTNPYCLRVWQTDQDDTFAWKIKGRFLHTDADPIIIEYVARIVDPTQFSLLFDDALTYRMAAAMAVPVTGDKALADRMGAVYDNLLALARTIGDQQGSPDVYEVRALKDVR